MLTKIAETIVPSQTSLENTGILNLVLPVNFLIGRSVFLFANKCNLLKMSWNHTLWVTNTKALALLETFVTHFCWQWVQSLVSKEEGGVYFQSPTESLKSLRFDELFEMTT